MKQRGRFVEIIKCIDYTEKLYSCVDDEFFTLLLLTHHRLGEVRDRRRGKPRKAVADLVGLTKVINCLVMKS